MLALFCNHYILSRYYVWNFIISQLKTINSPNILLVVMVVEVGLRLQDHLEVLKPSSYIELYWVFVGK